MAHHEARHELATPILNPNCAWLNGFAIFQLGQFERDSEGLAFPIKPQLGLKDLFAMPMTITAGLSPLADMAGSTENCARCMSK